MLLDNLDFKLLRVLDDNARTSESKIGKLIGTSKQVVKYRIDRLKKFEIIDNYYTLLDTGQLGFDSHYIFIQLTGINLENETKTYQKITNLNYVSWIITGIGRWDAVILVCSRSISEFNEQLKQLREILKNNLHEFTFTTLVNAEHISYQFNKSKTTEPIKTTFKREIINLDIIDKKILKIIDQSARIPITQISQLSGFPTHIIRYHLNSLIKKSIIKGFKPKINVQKLGFQWYLLLISIRSVSEKRLMEFIEYCRTHKNTYYLSTTVGKYALMLDIHVHSVKEFRTFLFDLKDLFSDVILLYESITVFEEKLITYTPKVIFED